jgi:predicted solute-binding protein
MALAERYARSFGMSAQRLGRYWKNLHYDFDAATQEGLLRYYQLAAALGEAPRVERIAWASQKARAQG